MKSFVFNPSDENFRIVLNSQYYVDKTDLIYHLNEVINTENRFISVSRPRRFGKTVTANMLTAYYSYSEKKTTIFNDRYIGIIYDELNQIDKQSRAEEHNKNEESKIINKNYKYLNKFNVIKLIMNEYFANRSVEAGIKKIMKKIINEIKSSINDIEFSDENDIIDIFEDLYKKTDRKLVFIIDEWDYILRHYKDEKSIYTYLEFLNTFLKDKEYIALAYVTGILPLKKNKEQSSLNNFKDFSMILPSWMAKYFGFTDNEVKELCKIYKRIENENPKDKISKIIKKHKRNDEKCVIKYIDNKEFQNLEGKEKKDLKHEKIYNSRDKQFETSSIKRKLSVDREDKVCYENLKNWYDGYQLIDEDDKIYNIYSPFSIINAFNYKCIESFWCKSLTSSILSDYLKLDYDGLKEDIVILMKRNRIKINIKTYQNDMTSFENKDDVLTMFIHLGYLGFDKTKSETFIPNKEILEEFENYTKSSNWSVLFKIYQQSKTLLQETWNCNEEIVAKLIEEVHDTADNKIYHSEAALKYAILLAYYAANAYYTIIPEMDTGKEYANIYFIPFNNIHSALVVELKYNKTAETVISQIKQRNYPKRLIHYKENLILVGINYDKTVKNNDIQFKYYSCKIEKHQI